MKMVCLLSNKLGKINLNFERLEMWECHPDDRGVEIPTHSEKKIECNFYDVYLKLKLKRIFFDNIDPPCEEFDYCVRE